MPGGATYGASGDFNKFDIEDLRWVNAQQLAGWQADSRPLVLVDVREPGEHQGGTIPGAQNLPQGNLFIDYKKMLPQMNEIAARSQAGEADIVLFANTGGVAGAAASRDLYVLNFLNQVATPAVPVERLVRLEGGVNGWKAAGFALAPPPKPAATASLSALLDEAGLPHLAAALAEQSLQQLAAVFEADGRTGLLGLLKGLGLSLSERQKVANAVSAQQRLRE